MAVQGTNSRQPQANAPKDLGQSLLIALMGRHKESSPSAQYVKQGQSAAAAIVKAATAPKKEAPKGTA